MNKIRIGKDIKILLKVMTNGESISLEGRNVELHLRNPFGDVSVIPHSVRGDVMEARFGGAEQKYCGVYTLTIWENKGGVDSTALDFEKAFELVSSTSLETPKAESLETEEVIKLSGDMSVGVQGASAYEIAVANGFKGTEAEWLESLKLHYADLTAEEKAELQKPITDIAAGVAEGERQRQQAEEIRKSAEVGRLGEEEKRVAEEEKRKTTEDARVADEEKRASAEVLRTEAEVLRMEAEQNRASAEILRTESEVLRTTAESKRSEAEVQRMTDEDLRKVAEQSRATAELARVNAEAERANAESLRASEEKVRVTSEGERKTAESARVSAEQQRSTAEQARVAAEEKRQQQTASAIEATKSATASAVTATAEAVKATTDAKNATTGANEAAKLATEAAAKTATVDYVVCKSTATTAVKEVTITGFTLSSHCRFLVKMTYAVDTEDVSLSVRSGSTLTEAKPLTFNGAPASVNNTWRAGDILDIYYDGTSFHATHYLGGYGITEINVSEMCPKGGINGTNKFTLAEAVKKIPEAHRRVGFKCSFINDNNKLQTFVYQGGAWSNVASWVEGGGGSLRPLFIAAGNGQVKYNAQTGFYEIGQYLKDVTEEEMMIIYNERMINSSHGITNNSVFCDKYIRSKARYALITHPVRTVSWGQALNWFRAFAWSAIEVFDYNIWAYDWSEAFRGCWKIRVVTNITLSGSSTTEPNGMFMDVTTLEILQLSGLFGKLILNKCPKLQIDSVLYLISNSRPNKSATINLHPDVYAKAIADERITEALQQHTNVSLTT